MNDSGFFYNSLKGNNTTTAYILTICGILISYGFLGSVPLLLDLKFHGYSFSQFTSMDDMIKILGKSRFLMHILFPFVLVFFSLWIGIKFFHKRPFLSLYNSFSHFRWKRVLSSFLIWMIGMSIILLFTIISSDEITLNFDLQKFIPLFFISILFIPIQTTAEELFFRSYLSQGIHPFIKNGLITVLITSLAFALLHIFNPEVQKIGNILILYYLITGIFLGLITLMDDGIELAMGYHAANNFFTSIMITNDWQVFRTDAVFIDSSIPTFTWDAIATLLIIQPLLIFIFSKLYKWKNWKEKIFS